MCQRHSDTHRCLFSIPSWTDRVAGMHRLVHSHHVGPLHCSPLPHHNLVLCEGEWTQEMSNSAVEEQKTTISFAAHLDASRACAVLYPQIVQEYERAVIFRLGRITDRKAKGPGSARFKSGKPFVFVKKKVISDFRFFFSSGNSRFFHLLVRRHFLCFAVHRQLRKSRPANSFLWHPATRGKATWDRSTIQ